MSVCVSEWLPTTTSLNDKEIKTCTRYTRRNCDPRITHRSRHTRHTHTSTSNSQHTTVEFKCFRHRSPSLSGGRYDDQTYRPTLFVNITLTPTWTKTSRSVFPVQVLTLLLLQDPIAIHSLQRKVLLPKHTTHHTHHKHNNNNKNI